MGPLITLIASHQRHGLLGNFESRMHLITWMHLQSKESVASSPNGLEGHVQKPAVDLGGAKIHHQSKSLLTWQAQKEKR
jgi:hypothetical protein